MSLVISRRSLILGLNSLVAAPALVRVTSLMDLAGYDMDPKVLAYLGDAVPVESQYSNNHGFIPGNQFYPTREYLPQWRALTVEQQARGLNWAYGDRALKGNPYAKWAVLRQSEIKGKNFRCPRIPSPQSVRGATNELD